MPDEPMITITVKEYERLKGDSSFLAALEAAGMDNWEGYEYACQIDAGTDPDDLI